MRNDAVLFLSSLACAILIFQAPATAQGCKDFAGGPDRQRCIAEKNPKAAAKLQRCKDRAVSLDIGKKDMKDFMPRCMRGNL
jgi:hypothetical protein